MSLLLLIEAVPLAVLVAVATIGIFSSVFHDTLIQRVGLSGLALGGCLKLAADLQGVNGSAACLILLYGAAIYAAGTLLRLYRRQRKA